MMLLWEWHEPRVTIAPHLQRSMSSAHLVADVDIGDGKLQIANDGVNHSAQKTSTPAFRRCVLDGVEYCK